MRGKHISLWIGVLSIGILLLAPGLSAGNMVNIASLPKASSVSQNPTLEIQDIKGGIGVDAYIHNNGTANATNVSWNIVFNGGLILFGRQSPDTIPGIEVGTAVLISSGYVFGIGRCTITITATCDQGATAHANATGIVLGFFVIGVK